MLTDEQVKLRKGRLTASNVGVLMRGEGGPIYRLWQELTDHPDYVPEDFSKVWPVQLGNCTEKLNLQWAEYKYGPIGRQGEVVYAFDPGWAACTLDGWLMNHAAAIECKHVGGREPYEVVLERYQPQLQWICHCCDCREVAFSVIIGANEPLIEFIPRDIQYLTHELIPRAEAFMQHVFNKTEPVDMPRVPGPTLIKKVYDMHDHPQWQVSASLWLQAHGAAETARDNEKILKTLMPAAAKMAHGCGVCITRNRAGYMSLREDK